MPGGPKKFIITEQHIKQAESLAAQGLTMEQIASVIGIGERTLYEKQEENPQLAQAIKRGRHKGVATIANALFNKAKGGDNTAMIFYLKNRAPGEWRDRREHELSGPDGGPIKTEGIQVTGVIESNKDS